MDKLKVFDAYPRPAEEFRVRTISGALISLVCGVVILVLVLGEFQYYRTVQVHPEITLDRKPGGNLNITFNITFPAIGCAYLGVDTIDINGNHQLDVTHGVFKQRLTSSGKPLQMRPRRELVDQRPVDSEQNQEQQGPQDAEAAQEQQQQQSKDGKKERCGDCYGAASASIRCCNTCSQLVRAYQDKGWVLDRDSVPVCAQELNTAEMKEQTRAKEGCQLYGYVTVSKVMGNFHIAPGVSDQTGFTHTHSVSMLPRDINVTHIIHSLSFGDAFPGQSNPLDGRVVVDEKGALHAQYFVNVVPTSYEYGDGRALTSSQFSVSTHRSYINLDKTSHNLAGTPGVYFSYDMSPIAISYREYRRSFAHFLTGVCAIVGGVFTIASFFDKVVYRGMHTFKEKVDLGKNF